MLEGIGIGAGVGLVVVAGIVITGIILLRKQQGQTERAWDRGDGLAKRLDNALEDVSELKTINALIETNLSELRRELDTNQTSLRELKARLESVERSRVNLANVLKSNPGLVTAVVGTAFDQLREEVSRAQAAAASATRDPGRREADPVHAGANDKPPG